jgi:hypothetical protein
VQPAKAVANSDSNVTTVAQHQVVCHQDEGAQLGVVEGVGRQHVGDEAELLAAFGEIGLVICIQPCGRAGIEHHWLVLCVHACFLELATAIVNGRPT